MQFTHTACSLALCVCCCCAAISGSVGHTLRVFSKHPGQAITVVKNTFFIIPIIVPVVFVFVFVFEQLG